VRESASSPDKCKKISERLLQAHHKNPAWREMLSAQMKKANPSKVPEVKRKVKEKWAATGHPLAKMKSKGGNGRPLPRQAQTLKAVLGEAWVMEHVILTHRRSPWPHCYKVDLALPGRMIVVELDGWSHTRQTEKKLDLKKDQFLEELGWSVLRFWNKEVDGNLPGVLSTISRFLGTPLTSPVVS
jgi:very-short-patch-repair endonuclease